MTNGTNLPDVQPLKRTANRNVDVDYLRSRLDYNPATGVFTWKVCGRNSVQVGDVAGTPHIKGYLHITLDRVMYLAHRLAWLFTYGEMPSSDIDHIDRDKVNNRISNLRLVTKSENRQNIVKHSNNTSGFKGVCLDKRSGRWYAVIKRNTIGTRLGYFDTAEEASVAYNEAAARLHRFNPSAAQLPTARPGCAGCGECAHGVVRAAEQSQIEVSNK